MLFKDFNHEPEGRYHARLLDLIPGEILCADPEEQSVTAEELASPDDTSLHSIPK